MKPNQSICDITHKQSSSVTMQTEKQWQHSIAQSITWSTGRIT